MSSSSVPAPPSATQTRFTRSAYNRRKGKQSAGKKSLRAMKQSTEQQTASAEPKPEPTNDTAQPEQPQQDDTATYDYEAEDAGGAYEDPGRSVDLSHIDVEEEYGEDAVVDDQEQDQDQDQDYLRAAYTDDDDDDDEDVPAPSTFDHTYSGHVLDDYEHDMNANADDQIFQDASPDYEVPPPALGDDDKGTSKTKDCSKQMPNKKSITHAAIASIVLAAVIILIIVLTLSLKIETTHKKIAALSHPATHSSSSSSTSNETADKDKDKTKDESEDPTAGGRRRMYHQYGRPSYGMAGSGLPPGFME